MVDGQEKEPVENIIVKNGKASQNKAMEPFRLAGEEEINAAYDP